MVLMKFDEDLQASLSKWIATSRKRLAILVGISTLGLLFTVLLTYRHPCLQV
jgi:hypothetical protein